MSTDPAKLLYDDEDTSISEGDGSEADGKPGVSEMAGIVAFLIAVGPIGLVVGALTRDYRIALWGIGSSLLYIAGMGLVITIPPSEVIAALGIDPFLSAVESWGVTVAETVAVIGSHPETYIILFVIGGAVLLVTRYLLGQVESGDSA